MSAAKEPDMVGLHDPTHYPPRQLQEKPERQPMPDDVRALGQNTPETAGRKISHPPPLKSRFDEAARRSRPRLPESDATSEPRAPARRGAMFGGAGRLAAAIGVSAVVALLIATKMPATRQADGGTSVSAAVEPFTSALSQQHQGEDASRPALAEFQPLLAGGDTALATERGQTDTQPTDKLLQQFLQWRRKASPSGAAR